MRMIGSIVRSPTPTRYVLPAHRASRSLRAIACLLICVAAMACRRRTVTTPTNACERAEGEWLGDDVESPNAAPEAIRVGRAVVQHEHWWISSRSFETEQSTGRTRERVQITERGAQQCTVDLVREGRRRTMIWSFTPDGRLRARAPNGLVTAVLRREPSP